MLCVSCGRRKGKRACPALRGVICTTCCGTKRLKEIACPSDCQYLASAEAHPPAAVLRQRERDLPLLSSLLEGLNGTQGDLLAVLTSQLRRARVGAIPPLRDEDVRDAASALASTLETAARGIVYEHQPASIPAVRLMRGWQEVLAEIERRGQTLRPGLVAPVLRRMEQAARDAVKTLGVEGDLHADVAFLDFLDRVMRDQGAGSQEAGARGPDARGPSHGLSLGAANRENAGAQGPAGRGGLLHGADTPSGLIVP